MSRLPPNRGEERALAREFGIVVGMDEVGRGALAGPVCVGAVAVAEAMPPEPSGLADSKLLSAGRRLALVEPIEAWALAFSVGWASAAEIDEVGIIGALRLAGWRAAADVAGQLAARDEARIGAILLDGNHDWFSPPRETLWQEPEGGPAAWNPPVEVPPVATRIKADLSCVAVSAASILAKVRRDAYMEQLPDCGYHWSSNKGYASASHRDGLRELGPSEQHRRSWNLLGNASIGKRKS